MTMLQQLKEENFVIMMQNAQEQIQSISKSLHILD